MHGDHVIFVVLLLLMQVCSSPTNEYRLHHFILKENRYNSVIRPPGTQGNNTSDETANQLTVKLGLRLSQLLDVSEKDQILTSSVWLRHEWMDLRLQWDPSDFGGLKYTHIPSKDLWLPDVILYNNADGEYAVTLLTKAKVLYTGHIIWEPPAIYKSYCPINVEFFPFDRQECFMKFGVWSYDGNEVDLHHVREHQGITIENKTYIHNGVDLCDYHQNVEWDIINVTARRKEKFYPCCGAKPFPDITFNITMRRKTLFYTINLIMPIIAISCLTVLVFYLPSDSGEKITLSISILLALTVFFLLLSDINPPTSIVIPLIGKYLLFTMIVVTMSIFFTVYTLSIHFRSPATHEMSPWIKRVFTEILPRFLCMKRPEMNRRAITASASVDNLEVDTIDANVNTPQMIPSWNPRPPPPNYENFRNRKESILTDIDTYPKVVRESLRGVKFIAEHLKDEDEESSKERDWNYVAMVMDRLFLFIFTTACVCGTIGIFLNAPSLYDPRGPMTRDNFDCARR